MTTLTTYRPTLLGRNVFDDFINTLDFPALMNRTTQGYPVADIFKNKDGSTTMEFALAGFEKENLHVDIIPDKCEIHISADSHGDEEQDGFKSRRIARRAFHKTFVNYDSNLDLSKAEANYENGLLRIKLPAKPESETLTVEIM